MNMKFKSTVLLAEDSQEDAFLALRAFRKLGLEHAVHRVIDGEQAIAYLGGEPPFDDRQSFPLPGLVLLDLKMPKVNGFEVLEWRRTKPELSHIPVVVLSSSNVERDIARATLLGAAEYKIKPSDFDDLLQILRGLCARWLGAASSPLETA